MSGRPARTRKRDKLKNWLGSDRHTSRDNSQVPSSGSSNIALVQAQTIQAEVLPSSSTSYASSEMLPAPSASSSTIPSTSIAAPSHATLSSSSTPTIPTRDLWADALNTLPEGERQAIRTIQPTVATGQPLSETMDALISMTKSMQNECEKGSYKFRFGEKEIILRDVAGKIVFWLNKFKDVGDATVNFAPVHAGLPWAGIRFLLQAAVLEHEQRGALLVSIEKATYLVNRGTIYERLYNPGTTSEVVLHNLHTALVELYAVILQSMALALQLFSENTATRTMHAIVNPGKVSDIFTKCRDIEAQVEIEAQNCERERSQKADTKTQDLLESLAKPILRTDEKICSLLENVDEKEHLDLLDWISTALHGKHHEIVREMRTKDTCEWLLKHNRYHEWQGESSSMILWLHGTAGTGKTYLTSRVIDEIRCDLTNNPNHEGFAFFYCNRNETDRQDPLSVLRSFVRQLSTTINDNKAIQMSLRQFCVQTRLNGSELIMSTCKEQLLKLLNFYPKTTLILDALDECEPQSRRELLEIFDYFVSHSSNPIKIFISSRPDGDIRERFKDLANIEIQAADNHSDISKYVESEIIKHRRWKKMPSELQMEIVETLQTQSQGMFQWAYLQIKQLLDLSQVKDIQDCLGKLPKDLKDTYDKIFNRMTRNERKFFNRAFQWVMCSCHPLSTDELLPAVCQDDEDCTVRPIDDLDEDLLLEYCHNLLVIDHSRNVWVPSHLSVVEYFENYHWSQMQANCLVATVCLSLLVDPTYCIEEADSENALEDESEYESEDISQHSLEEEIIQSNPSDDLDFQRIRLYARHHWMIHVRNCEERSSIQLSDLLKQFLGSPTVSSVVYRRWHRMLSNDSLPESSIFKRYWHHPTDLEPASLTTFAICAFGFFTTLSGWWDDPWPEFAHTNKRGTPLLELAVMAESVSICRRLIDWGTEVNKEIQYGRYGSALVAAAYKGNTEITKLLIKSGAVVNTQLQDGSYGSALVAAAYEGNEEVMELLFESGAEINTQLEGGDFGSVLAAAVCWHEEIAELLIESGAEVNAQLQAGDFGSALAAAAERGNEEAVELLLESGAEVNAQLQAGLYGSALAAGASAFWNATEVVKLLIKSGAEVNRLLQVGWYGSALAAAANHDNKEVVKLLLESGGEVNAQLQAGDYGSVLAAAAGIGYKDSTRVVKLLIESGAEVNAKLQVGRYGSALAAAASKGNKEIVKLLLKSGAEVNEQLQVGKYGSVLATAAAAAVTSPKPPYNDYIGTVKLLIEWGAEVNAQLQIGDYGSALAAAAGAGFLDCTKVVKLLIESGADVNLRLQVGDYGSALAAAAGAGYRDSTKVVNMLIKSGAEVNAKLQTGRYGSALVAAVADKDRNKEGENEGGENQGGENEEGENEKDESLEQELWRQNRWKRKRRNAELLIRSGAEVNMQLPFGRYRSALEAGSGNKEMVELLMKYSQT